MSYVHGRQAATDSLGLDEKTASAIGDALLARMARRGMPGGGMRSALRGVSRSRNEFQQLLQADAQGARAQNPLAMIANNLTPHYGQPDIGSLVNAPALQRHEQRYVAAQNALRKPMAALEADLDALRTRGRRDPAVRQLPVSVSAFDPEAVSRLDRLRPGFVPTQLRKDLARHNILRRYGQRLEHDVKNAFGGLATPALNPKIRAPGPANSLPADHPAQRIIAEEAAATAADPLFAERNFRQVMTRHGLADHPPIQRLMSRFTDR